MIAFWSAPNGLFKGISAVCAQIERFNQLMNANEENAAVGAGGTVWSRR